MRLIRLEDIGELKGDTAVCLGTFDGVHLGHQALAQQTVLVAGEKGLIPCAYALDVPPASVFGRLKGDQVLTTMSEKAALLSQYGMEIVAYSHFDMQIAEMPARTFFEELLRGKLRARHIIIGFHYHFGQRAQGDAHMMQALCDEYGMGLSIVEPVRTPEGELVSSTAIRALLRAGDRDGAQKMLNRALSEREEHLLGGWINE